MSNLKKKVTKSKTVKISAETVLDEKLVLSETRREADVPELTDAQLGEEFNRVLAANDPYVSKKVSRFHFKDGAFKDEIGVDQTTVHFSFDGTIALIGSDEARPDSNVVTSSEVPEEDETGENNAPDVNNALAAASESASKENKDTKERNQFNYSQRSSQTYSYPMVSHSTSTLPMTTKTFSGTATQAEIFQAYMDQWKAPVQVPVVKASMETLRNSTSFAKIVSQMERLVSANSKEKQIHSLKYDVEDGGSLIPLFTFTYPLAPPAVVAPVTPSFVYSPSSPATVVPTFTNPSITALCWHPVYDIFAVGYGSFGYKKDTKGSVSIYSLKKPSSPMVTFSIDSSVSSLDMNGRLLVVGCYDGSLRLYDLKFNKLLFENKGLHTEPVWSVSLCSNVSFLSVSSDGLIRNWTLGKNELEGEILREVKLVSKDENVVGLAAPCAFAEFSQNEAIFLVGTEEGCIMKCDRAFPNQYMQTYQGHCMPVYTVAFSPFSSHFLSCSSDWTLRVWSNTCSLVLDCGASVGDACWSPSASTILVAVTDRVLIFDLELNKNKPVFEYELGFKGTKVRFHPKLDIILVGDDKGTVNVLKLPASLRKGDADKKSEETRINRIMQQVNRQE